MQLVNILKVATMATIATIGAAHADTTTVSCEGYLVTLEEADTIAIQAVLGSGAAFDKGVCDETADLNMANFETPSKTKVELSDGSEVSVMVQKKADK